QNGTGPCHEKETEKPLEPTKELPGNAAKKDEYELYNSPSQLCEFTTPVVTNIIGH
ncbi:5149_t:CDS:1, partial [Cetraspora pellucida]